MTIPGLSSEQFKLVRSFLPHDCRVKLFGSRVKGNFRESSDLDICIVSDISRSDMAKITELFEESNLPFTVDLIQYRDCDEKFKKIIDDTGVSICIS